MKKIKAEVLISTFLKTSVLFSSGWIGEIFVSMHLLLTSGLISLFQCFFCQYSSFSARDYNYMAYSRKCRRCREFLFLLATLRYREVPWLKTDSNLFVVFPSLLEKYHLLFTSVKYPSVSSLLF